MQAIILAAGMGSRLTPYHEGPKALLQFGASTILEESLDCLRQNGIEDIILVTGFQPEKFQSIISKYRLRAVLNEYFATTGSLRSLLLTEPLICEDVLVLEADLIYDCRAINELRNAPWPNSALLSEITGHGDEVYAYSQNGELMLFSKQKFPKLECAGEFVGITKLSLAFMQKLFVECGNQRMSIAEYDSGGLISVSKTIPLRGYSIPDLIWSEIDDIIQLQNARNNVYPRLLGRS